MNKRRKIVASVSLLFLLLGAAAFGAFKFARMQPEEQFEYPQSGQLAVSGPNEKAGVEKQEVSYYPDNQTKKLVQTKFADGHIEREYFRMSGKREAFVVLDGATNEKVLERLYDLSGAVVAQTIYPKNGTKELHQKLGAILQRSIFADDQTTLSAIEIKTLDKSAIVSLRFYPDGKRLFSLTVPNGSVEESHYFRSGGDKFAVGLLDSSGEQNVKFVSLWSPNPTCIYRQPRYGERAAVHFDNLGHVEDTVRWSSNGDYEFTKFSDADSDKEVDLVAGVKSKQVQLYSQTWKCLRSSAGADCQYKLESVTEFDIDGKVRTVEFDISTGAVVKETMHVDKGVRTELDKEWLKRIEFEDPMQLLQLPQPESDDDED